MPEATASTLEWLTRLTGVPYWEPGFTYIHRYMYRQSSQKSKPLQKPLYGPVQRVHNPLLWTRLVFDLQSCTTLMLLNICL